MGWWGLMPYAPLLQEFLDCTWGKLSTIVWPYHIWNGGSAKEVCHDIYQFNWLGVVPNVYNFWPVSLAFHDDQKFFATRSSQNPLISLGMACQGLVSVSVVLTVALGVCPDNVCKLIQSFLYPHSCLANTCVVREESRHREKKGGSQVTARARERERRRYSM